MNFNQLKYIIAIDSFRNFSKAADFCNIAQSTLSREVQKLERKYEIMLFDRSRIPVVPTLKGQELIAHAKKILQALEQFEDVAREKDNPVLEGTFHLGVHPGLAPYLLPLFLIPFAARHPKLRITVSEADQKQMDQQLQTGQLDGCIIIHPFYKDGYYETRMFNEYFVLYVDENHPLRKYPSLLPEDIPYDTLLIHEDIRNELLNNTKTTDHTAKNIIYQSGSLETIRKIIDLHGGVTLLPETACIYMGERRKKLTIPIQSENFKRTISFIAPRGFHKKRIIKALIKEITLQIAQKLKHRQASAAS